MLWLEEWRALTDRIEGLALAAEGLISSFGVRDVDDLNMAAKLIGPAGKRLTAEISRFVATYEHSAPPAAIDVLRQYLAVPGDFTEDSQIRMANVQRAVALRAVASEVQYLLRDTEVGARTTVDRAFLHLQRSLVVDDELRRKWEHALEDGGETRCEELGALHLLGHGIFAFKAAGVRAVTDLILHAEVNPHDVETARLAALTEWKVARTDRDAEAKVMEAKAQASIYAGGVLAGMELRKHRYLVVVSPTTLRLPADFEERGITYHPVGLPLDGATPSAIARKLGRRR